METRHPFQARSILPVDEKNSEYAISQVNLLSTENRDARVNLENIFPEQLNSKLVKQDLSSYQPNRGRFEPYGFPSRTSRDREDRREREDPYRYRADSRDVHREERSSLNRSYSFTPSYYGHNRCAGANADEVNFGNITSPVTSTFEDNRRSEDNRPPPIVISRDPNNGKVLVRSEGAHLAHIDTMFPHVGEREGQPKHSDNFGSPRNSRGRGYSSNNFDRINRSGSSRERNRSHSYRDYRSNEFSYFSRGMESRDCPSRGPDSFSNSRDREWERDRSRDRDRPRWERHRDRSRDWDPYEGRPRWDSERIRERDRKRDASSNRFEHGDSYRPASRSRDYFEKDLYRRDFYRDFRREPAGKDTYDYYFHSRNSHTPERRSSSVESTRYPGRRNPSRSEASQNNCQSVREFDGSRHSSCTRHNSASTERSSQERTYEKLHQHHEVVLNKPDRTLPPSKATLINEKQATSTQSGAIIYDNKSNHKEKENMASLSESCTPEPPGSQDGDKSTLTEQIKSEAPCLPEVVSGALLNSLPINCQLVKDQQSQTSNELAKNNPQCLAINKATFECQSQRSPNSDEIKINKSSATFKAITDPQNTKLAVTKDLCEVTPSLTRGIKHESGIVLEAAFENAGETPSAKEPWKIKPYGPNKNLLCEASELGLPNEFKDHEVLKLNEAKAEDFEEVDKVIHANEEKDDDTLATINTVSDATMKENRPEAEADTEKNTPLTTERIFAMIDHIDSEIGHYEALLAKVRENKQSCMENDPPQMEDSNHHFCSHSVKKESMNSIETCKEESTPRVANISRIETEIAIVPDKPGQLSHSRSEYESQQTKKPSLFQKIYAENRSLVKSNVKPFPGPVYKNIEDYPFYLENIESHKKIRNLMFTHLKLKASTLEEKETKLRQEYKEHLEDWRIRVVKLDRKREKRRSKQFMEDELLTSNINGISARSQRRGGFYNADAVRSEAELMEIIQYLEHEDLRNPDVRSVRAATIPSMILDPSKRELTKYDNRNNLVEDPYNYYHCDKSVDKWTREERDIFIKKYLLYPKQFGKIASFLKNKDPRQCVLYYYREKKSIDFKGLISGRGKKRRQLARKGTGKRAGRKKKSKGNALLQDIDEAERSTQISEDPPDSPPYSEKKRPRGFDDESTLSESQKSRRKSRTKQRQHSLPDEEEEEEESEIKTAPHQPSPSTARWSEDDRHIALQAYKKFGQDFYSVSKMVGSKTEEQCRNFYYNFRRKHGMSALEAPLEMTCERESEAKVASFSNDSQVGKPSQKQQSSAESLKSERQQPRIKRKRSEIYPTGNPSVEQVSDQNQLGNRGCQTITDSPLTSEPNVEQVISPVSTKCLTGISSSLHEARPQSAPSENFLGLLVQAAFNQDAELSKRAVVNIPSTSPISSALTSTNSCSNLVNPITIPKNEEKTIDCSDRQHTDISTNSAGMRTSGIQRDSQICFPRPTFDSSDLLANVGQSLPLRSTNPPPVREFESTDQVRQSTEAVDAFSLLNLATEEHKATPRQSFKEDVSHSTPVVLDSPQVNAAKSLGQKPYLRAQEIYHIPPNVHSFESTISPRHSKQDSISHIERKFVEQRETQPVRQLQLLQIQSPPTTGSQPISQITLQNSHSRHSPRVNLSHHPTPSSLSSPPLPGQSGRSVDTNQATRPSMAGTTISPSQAQYHMSGTAQQAPEKPPTFPPSYSQPMHPSLHY